MSDLLDDAVEQVVETTSDEVMMLPGAHEPFHVLPDPPSKRRAQDCHL